MPMVAARGDGTVAAASEVGFSTGSLDIRQPDWRRSVGQGRPEHSFLRRRVVNCGAAAGRSSRLASASRGSWSCWAAALVRRGRALARLPEPGHETGVVAGVVGVPGDLH